MTDITNALPTHCAGVDMLEENKRLTRSEFHCLLNHFTIDYSVIQEEIDYAKYCAEEDVHPIIPALRDGNRPEILRCLIEEF